MNPLVDFDIQLISLPERTDRRRECKKSFALAGIPWSAVSIFSAVRPSEAAGFPSVGARGCFMSHLQVLRRQLDADRPTLICEDDLNFGRNFSDRIDGVLGTLRTQPWDLFYGGGHPGVAGQHMSIHACDLHIGNTHMVAFHPRVVSRVVAFFEEMQDRSAEDPRGGPMHVDFAYSCFRRLNPDVVTRVAIPELGYQRASRSNVQIIRWKDRIPILRAIADPLRRVKNIWIAGR